MLKQRQSIVKDLFETVKGWLIEDGLSSDLAVLLLVTVDGFWFKSVIEESNELATRGRQLRRQLRKLVLVECQPQGLKPQQQIERSARR